MSKKKKSLSVQMFYLIFNIMPSFKTYKKVRKWRNAYDRCFTASTRHLKFGFRRRVSRSKIARVYRNLDLWSSRQFYYAESWFHPGCYYYDKRKHTVFYEYYD